LGKWEGRAREAGPQGGWRRSFPLLAQDVANAPAIVLAFVVGAIGAYIFFILKLPLPFFLGALTACFVAAVLNVPIAPPRALSIPIRCVIGAAIGAAFTPALLTQLPNMLGSLALFVPYAIGILAFGYFFFERIAGLDKPTAFFSAVPGGLTDMILLGAEAGANQRVVTLIQATRILVIVFAIPLILNFTDGIDLGGRVVQTLGIAEMRALDGLLLVAICWLGWKGAVVLRLAGAPIVGPMIVSALAHGSVSRARRCPSRCSPSRRSRSGRCLGAGSVA